MTHGFITRLEDRGVLSVSGPGAHKLLQGVITNDMDLLSAERPSLFAGLLSPQGKVLFDFMVVRDPNGDGSRYVLDVARDQAAALSKRLSLYKLRAKADIRDESETLNVLAMWGENASFICLPGCSDPRHNGLGLRAIGKRQSVADDISCSTGRETSPEAYHAHRIAIGVPEGGKDYAFAYAFPHEALFDQVNGVSFTKGCYVGQEIVARMEHRGTARNRIVKVSAETALPAAGTPVVANDVTIGAMGSSSGPHGLAMVRLDRLAEFNDRGVGITIGGLPVTLTLQDWIPYSLSDFTRTARL